MSSKTLLPEQLNNEFRSGFMYFSRANESNKYTELAKKKIENAMEIFKNIQSSN